jgi:GTPase Era involved in 16S rRNA processing
MYILGGNPMQPLEENKTKIVFIGPIGSGKSATINTLLGENRALSENNLQSGSLTKDITEYPSQYGLLVDTPGLTEERLPSLLDYLTINPPDAVVIVFATSRLRSSQKEAIQLIQKISQKYLKKGFLLLTKGGDLKDNEHDFLGNGKSKELFSLYDKVGKRCIVFENLPCMEGKQKYVRKFEIILQQILSHKDPKTLLGVIMENVFGNVRKFFTFKK